MVALFKDRSPVAIVWLFLLSFAVHSSFIFYPPSITGYKTDGLLSSFLAGFVTGSNAIVLTCIYHLVVIVQALVLNTIFSNNHMFGKVNYLVAMVYILLTGLFTGWSHLSPPLLTNFMLIWLFAMYINLYNHPSPNILIYNIGLLTGLTVLLYHPSALLIISALFAVMVVRPFYITEWLVLLMGIISPYYFLFSYLYLFDKLHTYQQYIPLWQLNLPDVQPSAILYATLALLFFVLIIGFIYWRTENRRLIIQVRKNWSLLLAMFFIMLPVPFINKGADMNVFLLWLIPASPFIAKGFFVPKRNTLPDIMFWCLLIVGIVKSWSLFNG